MYKLFLLFVFVSCYYERVAGQEHAQQAYHFFQINNKVGIVDTLGREILPPLYQNRNRKEDRYWVMKQNDTSLMLFDSANGRRRECKRIEPYAVRLEDGYYMYVLPRQGFTLFLNEKTGDSIPVFREYTAGLRREGAYLFAAYLPDKTVNNYYSRRVDVLDIKHDMHVIATGVYPSIQLLYKTGRVQQNDEVYVDFDAVLFSSGHEHQLYDGKLKHVKNFRSTLIEPAALAKTSSTILKYSLTPHYKEWPAEPPGLAVSSLDGVSLPKPPIEKLRSKKLVDGTTLVYLERQNDDVVSLFTATADQVYIDDNEIELYRVNAQFNKEDTATFTVDFITGRCLLPAAYWASSNMIPITKQ
ncbi:hypothetical protein [Sphingobacterium sp. HMA12]|uniref:hypothetical protein n=1 Tax=Sphingobacterium sp. HMA12 TaxID=2050894 RepID=UPI000CEA48B3|nr:hypothetical protein [Sphingobacterium sp. HMA12]